MTNERVKRKMSAILSADAKDYSRLMSADEEGTVKDLNACREIITGCVQEHRGRVVDSPGDNVLAEFASTVEAVKCAVQIQEELKARNANMPEDRRMEFRIGVNLGDVIEEEDRIYGDGVNIAARLEGLADPAGVCISGTAFDQVKGKLSLGYEFVGEQTVKNIPDPVRAYNVLMDEKDAGKLIGVEKKASKPRWMEISAVVVFIAIGLIIYQFYVSKQTPPVKETSAEKASIAVLPFDNMSNDPEQEYFSNGIAENLITDLSKVPDIAVIARTTSFAYRDKSLTIEQIAKELDVNYVLEGSVQRAGDKLRINAQLINASTGHHLWAERYDGNISDIFSLQDQITLKIASSLALTLTDDEQARLTQHGTNNIEAYEAFLKGSDLANYLRMDTERMAKAIPWFEKAIELDPGYSNAYAGLAEAYMRGSILGIDRILGISLRLTRMRAVNYLNIAMKNPTHLAYREMARLYVQRRQFEEALKSAEKAITIDPNNADNNSMMAQALIWSGSPDEAIPFLERMRRTDPACLF